MKPPSSQSLRASLQQFQMDRLLNTEDEIKYQELKPLDNAKNHNWMIIRDIFTLLATDIKIDPLGKRENVFV